MDLRKRLEAELASTDMRVSLAVLHQYSSLTALEAVLKTGDKEAITDCAMRHERSEANYAKERYLYRTIKRILDENDTEG